MKVVGRDETICHGHTYCLSSNWCVWRVLFMYITWPIHMCHMTSSYFAVTHTAVNIFYMCATIQLDVWHDSYICVRLPTATHTTTHAATHTVTQTAWLCLAWNICVTWLIHMCDMTHTYVWDYSFIRVPWPMYTCDVTPAQVSVTHTAVDTFHMCDMTHPYQSHDPIIRLVGSLEW